MPNPAATAAANHGFGLILSELHKKIKDWRSVEEDCSNMERNLNILVAYMDDEIRRDAGTNVSRARVEEVRELVHDMEDCIERFMYRITCLDGSRSLRRIVHKFQTWRIRVLFSKEIKKLNKRLETAKVDHLRRLADVTAAPAGAGRDPIQDRPVGMDAAKEEVRTLLDEVENEPARLRVISIVGFGGSGKTTLAYAVYQSLVSTQDKRFPLRAWVHRADYKDASGLLKTIIKKLWRNEGEKIIAESFDDEWYLQRSLKEHLANQRYLIVLDDMDMELWRWIESTFQDQGTSSRIIVTASRLPTANLCCGRSDQRNGDGYVYQMRSLGDRGSKTIARLNEIAHDGSCPCHQGQCQCPLESLQKKCDGLPLALVGVARHFTSKSRGCPTTVECTALCNDLGYLLQKKPDQTPATAGEQLEPFADLRGVLMNNFISLADAALGSCCLLYLGICPDARHLNKNKITRRWVAEGYTPCENRGLKKSEQDVAGDNFQKLIDWNIIQPLGISTTRTCKALGIVHEFVLHKSKSENFIMTIDSAEQSRASRTKKHTRARHLFVRGSNITSSGAAVNLDLSCARSLTVVTLPNKNTGSGSAGVEDVEGHESESVVGHGSGRAGDGFFKFIKYKVIRVLDLEECTEVTNNDLSNICKLWNLRYLSLGPKVDKLTKEIAQLELLEALHLSKRKVTELPEEIIDMPCLVHLIGKFLLNLRQGAQVETCPELKEKCQKCKLETLSAIVSSKRQGFLLLVPYMKALKKVKICFSESREPIIDLSDPLLTAIIGYLEHKLGYNASHSLCIDFRSLYKTGYESYPWSVMEDLHDRLASSGKHYYLTSLKLHDKLLSSMPQFVVLLSGLTKLCLSLESLEQDLLSAVSELETLKHLRLVSDKIPVDLHIPEAKFQILTSFCIQVRGPDCAVPQIKIQGELPHLRSFQLICQNVAGLCGIEIKKFTNLLEIELHPNVTDVARQEWEAAARKHPKRPNVLPLQPIADDQPQAAVGGSPQQDDAPAAVIEDQTSPVDAQTDRYGSAEDISSGASQVGEPNGNGLALDEVGNAPPVDLVPAVILPAGGAAESVIASTITTNHQPTHIPFATQTLAQANQESRHAANSCAGAVPEDSVVSHNCLSDEGPALDGEEDDQWTHHEPSENPTDLEPAATDTAISAQPLDWEASKHDPEHNGNNGVLAVRGNRHGHDC